MGDQCDVFVNEWQREEFERLQLSHRDPMIFTMYILLELDTFPTVEQVRDYCRDKVEQEEVKENMWLSPGMPPGEVAVALQKRLMESDKWGLMFRSCQER